MKETKEMNKEVIELTESEIKERLESFSFEELFKVNQFIAGTGDYFTWYYTFQEMYDTHFEGDIVTFLQRTERNSCVDIDDDYMFFEQITGNSGLESISKEDLEDVLRDRIEALAEHIFYCQEYEDENAYELIEKALKID